MRKLTTLALMLCCLSPLQAKVTLPGTFTDNMILQQQRELQLEGSATPSSSVSIRMGWSKKAILTQVDKQGHWTATLTTPKASTRSYTLTFDDGEPTTLHNVLVGEVWFCSGQSNMEMPVEGWGHVMNWEQEKADACYPMIRIFQVEHTSALTPQDRVPQGYTHGWQEVSPQSIGEFSSTAYFYARELWNKLHIPVGVINSSWGGTPAEAWTSHSNLKQVTGFVERCQRIEQTGFDPQRIDALYHTEQQERAAALLTADRGVMGSIDTPLFASDHIAETAWPTMTLPGYWEGQGLGNLDGVVWYRKSIILPDELAGSDLHIDIGCIDDEDITYWNGEKVAQGSGYNQHRHYTVPGRLVKAGRNTLTIRVTDGGSEGGVGGEAKAMRLSTTDGRWSISLAGQWHYAVGADARLLPPAPTQPGSSWWPSGLYNAMVYPFRHFPIRGVIWYQGCANVDRAAQYEPLFQTLIHDWQECFQQPQLPFHFVQLANYLTHHDLQPESQWASLREAQRMATQIEGVEMMVNIDLGEAGDIHPKNKQEVGRRLAALSLARTYGQKIAAEAPSYSHITIKGDVVTVHFTQSSIAEPLLADSHVKGFSIQAADGTWHLAQAQAVGQTVVVSAPDVKFPVAVRYGWADNPSASLQTRSGFRVSPFSSTHLSN